MFINSIILWTDRRQFGTLRPAASRIKQEASTARRAHNRWDQARRWTPLWSAKSKVRVPLASPQPVSFRFQHWRAFFSRTCILILQSLYENNLLLLWRRGEVNWTKSQHVDGLHRVTFFTVICAKRKNFHFYSISFSFKYPFDAIRSQRNAFCMAYFCNEPFDRLTSPLWLESATTAARIWTVFARARHYSPVINNRYELNERPANKQTYKYHSHLVKHSLTRSLQIGRAEN